MSPEPYISQFWKQTESSSDEPGSLSLFVGNQCFTFALFNHDLKNILEIGLVSVNPHEIKNYDQAEQLRFLIHNNRLHEHKYKTVNIAILNSAFTLMPAAYALVEETKSVLGLTNGNDQAPVNSFIHRFDELNFCYSVPQDVLSVLEKTFKNATVRHAGAITIDLLFSNASLKNAHLLLNFNEGVFELAAKDNNKLVYYNLFNYETNEDVLYYLLFMMEQYSLNPITCKLAIAGQMPADSELLKAIRKYVKNVEFAVNDKSFSASFGGLKLPDHYFFSLTNQHLCVL